MVVYSCMCIVLLFGVLIRLGSLELKVWCFMYDVSGVVMILLID